MTRYGWTKLTPVPMYDSNSLSFFLSFSVFSSSLVVFILDLEATGDMLHDWGFRNGRGLFNVQ